MQSKFLCTQSLKNVDQLPVINSRFFSLSFKKKGKKMDRKKGSPNLFAFCLQIVNNIFFRYIQIDPIFPF